MWQHDWALDQVGNSGSTDQPGSSSSANDLRVYEYQTGRLRAGYQRMTALKTQIRARQELVAEAQRRRDDMAKSLAQRRAELQELKQGEAAQAERTVGQAKAAQSKRAAQVAKVSSTLRKDRGILANALCQVVGLQTTGAAAVVQSHGEDEDEDEEVFFLNMDMDDRKR
ncbi:hypothetical protein IWW38_005077, partial [Coemansia aciculifera]